jgi:hypothetical protein
MRHTLLKLRRGNSTKNERRFAEFLKEKRIPFKTKIKIDGLELDFLIGRYAIEIDGHYQNGLKNLKIMSKGYIPIHINNKQTKNKKWLEQMFSGINQELLEKW